MAPTGRPDGLGLHPPAGGGRSVLLSGTDFAGMGDAAPIPGLSGSAYLRGAMAGGIGWWLLV